MNYNKQTQGKIIVPYHIITIANTYHPLSLYIHLLKIGIAQCDLSHTNHAISVIPKHYSQPVSTDWSPCHKIGTTTLTISY